MLFKLATRNIRRSVKDYAIYFVTLLAAITIFYAFNSVSDQQVMQEIMASDKARVVEFTGVMMNLFSGVIAFVLGFLVIYANQLLIKRRKHEFGMYFTLGMKAGQVSRVILYETVLVGLVSLVLGLALGVAVSQLLSFFTAALFEVPMPDYQFTFSMIAFNMTLVCFVAIYVVVAIFNVISIRRHKLIDLLNADSKSQRVVIRNPWVSLALFIISIGILAYAYWQLDLNGMSFLGDDYFIRATIGMLVGTLLLFFSLAGFMIAVVTRIRAFYLRKLRPFTTRQVASKVNTSFASVWVVSVLLFLAITTFATGMGLVELFTAPINKANPYDASVISYQRIVDDPEEIQNEKIFNVSQSEEFLKKNFEGWDDLVAESSHIDIYMLPDMTYGDLMSLTGTSVNNSTTIYDQQVEIVGVSQFNEAMRFQGKPTVELGENEYLVTNNMALAEHIGEAAIDQKTPLQTPVGSLVPQDEMRDVQLYDYAMTSNGLTMVVPDRVTNALDFMEHGTKSAVNIKFKANSDAEDVFEDRVYSTEMAGVTSAITRQQMIEQSKGLRMVITYLALYIGLVLLVATAAVLAIQLLSLTIDSTKRYRMLSRLGCDLRMLSKSLFAQVLIYFLLPLVVAVCHSAWTINILSDSLFSAVGTDLLPSISLSAGLVLVIYGGYLLITFFASRSTVKQGLRQTS